MLACTGGIRHINLNFNYVKFKILKELYMRPPHGDHESHDLNFFNMK